MSFGLFYVTKTIRTFVEFSDMCGSKWQDRILKEAIPVTFLTILSLSFIIIMLFLTPHSAAYALYSLCGANSLRIKHSLRWLINVPPFTEAVSSCNIR
jgi:hypothetical protein